MAPHKLKPARATVPLLLRLTEHPLVTVPPPQKLDPAEPTLERELPALMEDTKNPLLQPHYLQLQRGARHSMADTPAPLLSQHLLSYRRGKTNINSNQMQHIFMFQNRRFSREDSSDSGSRYATRKRDDSDSFVSYICNGVYKIYHILFIGCFPLR